MSFEYFKKILFISILGLPYLALGQSPEEEDYNAHKSIVTVINDSNGTVSVRQSSNLDALVGYAGGSTDDRGLGYRIQIFSDNNVRTAKANAEHRKRLIEAQNPEIRTYLTFESPYWRVRVGDYRTQSEAASALRELKSSFPSFASDFRVVRERINVPQ